MEKVKKLISEIYTLIGFLTVVRKILPPTLLKLFARWWSLFLDRFFWNSYFYMEVPEFVDTSSKNEVYENVGHYIANLDTICSARKLSVFLSKDSNSLELSPASDGTVQDSFQGAIMWWSHKFESLGKEAKALEKGHFTLKIQKKNKSLVIPYFDHIANGAAEFKRSSKRITLYGNESLLYGYSLWQGVPFNHPSTFDSLALDPIKKDKILRDLDWFRKSKQFYRRVGRPWKRGYLLYGPPGTGKSSFVAAIANYMKYNVYELELTRVSNNSSLRSLLISTTNQSIIVIEDIDCTIHISNRLLSDGKQENANKKGQSQVTLSGILNFADGLWSCCGEERIIIFTTNYKEKLDPALLRSGRMDMHILFSYCTFPVFKSLASTYLQIDDDPLFSEVEEIMKKSEVQMTPAEMSEIMITYMNDPVQALNTLVSALNNKINGTQLSTSISKSL